MAAVEESAPAYAIEGRTRVARYVSHEPLSDCGSSRLIRFL